MAFRPQPSRQRDRIDKLDTPPPGFIAKPMQGLMMIAADRNRELIARLQPARFCLDVGQVVGFDRPLTARRDRTLPAPDKCEVCRRTVPRAVIRGGGADHQKLPGDTALSWA
jgi:hypothetical protein